MDTIDYRTRLHQELCDRQFATEYFVAAAQSGDAAFLQCVLHDLLAAGDGVYPPVELNKLRSSANAAEPSGIWGEYQLGKVNNTSLPVDYVLTGILIGPPRIGTNVIILRLTRNGIVVPGVYQSTEVKNIAGDEFTTLNSVYKIKLLPR